MRLPGLAWLDLCVDEDDAGRTVFRQKAYFHPRGLAGQPCWWAVTPFHGIVFGGMQRNIARVAEEFERTGSASRRTSRGPLHRLRSGTASSARGLDRQQNASAPEPSATWWWIRS
jgi:hypothetical protein